MPLFRTTIFYANGRRRIAYEDIDGVDINAYYNQVLQRARSSHERIASFDAVQLSDLSSEAITVRENIKRK